MSYMRQSRFFTSVHAFVDPRDDSACDVLSFSIGRFLEISASASAPPPIRDASVLLEVTCALYVRVLTRPIRPTMRPHDDEMIV